MLTARLSVGEFSFLLKFHWITQEDDPEDDRIDDSENTRVLLLCHDLLLNIFSRLPDLDVIRCKLVSKEWHTIISTVMCPMMSNKEPVIGLYFANSLYEDRQQELSSEGLDRSDPIHAPQFTNLECYGYCYGYYHQKRAVLRMDVCKDYRFRGRSYMTLMPFYFLRTPYLLDCCNGLLLFAHPLRPIYYVCNPVTRQCVPVPAPPSRTSLHGPSFFAALAFDPSESSHYRVVLLSFETNPECLDIFHSHLGKWSTFRPKLPQGSQLLKQPFYWKGALYGLSMSQNLLRFGLDAMKLSVIGPPDKEIPFGEGYAGVLNGKVSYAIRDPHCLRIWSLEEKNDHSEWCLYYEVLHDNLLNAVNAHMWSSMSRALRDWLKPYPLDPCAFDSKSEVIFVAGPKALGMYDLQDRSFRLLQEGNFQCIDLFPIFTYSRSFVTLNNIGFEDGYGF